MTPPRAKAAPAAAAAPLFLDGPEALRDWFARHAATSTELVVGFVKTHTGRAPLTWPQSVDEALCVGWIDGVRTRIDDEHYKIRFTPRKPSSHWSAVNIRRVAEVAAQGRMTPAGLAAFAARTEERSVRASYEQRDEDVAFDAASLRELQRHPQAWQWFQAQPPGWRKQMTWRVMNAKRADTRDRRLALLIAACAEGRRL